MDQEKKVLIGAGVTVIILVSLIFISEFRSVGKGAGGAPAPGGGNITITTPNYADSYLISSRNDKQMETSNNNVPHSIIEGEQIRDIQTFIGEEELSALSDNFWNVAGKDYEYQQFLFFDSKNKKNEIVKYDEDDNDVNSDFIYFKNDEQIARYKLEFKEAPNSRITDVDGNLTPTGNYLPDFQDTKLTIFDHEYMVTSATRPTPEGLQLTLIKPAKSDDLLVGENRTYYFNSKKYEVEVLSISSGKAQLNINSEVIEPNFNALQTSSDGTKIMIDSVWLGEPGVRLYLDIEKMVLRDDDATTDHESSHNLEIDNEIIDGAEVIMNAANISETFILFFIEVNMTAEDDFWVPVGSQLSDSIALEGEDSKVLVNNFFDFDYKGLTSEPTHGIGLKTSSNQRYDLAWYDGNNKKVDMPLAYAEEQFNLSLGENSWDEERTNQHRIILQESVPIYKDDYFVVTGGNPEDGTAKSYLLQYIGADRITKTSPKMKFKNSGTGETLEFPVPNENPRATVQLGGFLFVVENASDVNSDDFLIYVDLDVTTKETIVKETVANPITDTLLEGESGDYNLGDYEYSVALTYVDVTTAKFNVNGEVTSKLAVGESYTLNDGDTITVSEVSYQSFAGGVHSAEFTLSENPVIEGYDHEGIGNEIVPVVDSYGSVWSFDWNLNSSSTLEDQDQITITQTTPNEDDYDNQKPSDITLNITSTAGPKVTTDLSGLTLLTPDGETGIAYGYTSMGSFVTFETPVDSPELFTMNYPQEQRLPQVYILSSLVEEEGCINPTDGMTVSFNMTFCDGEYYLPSGISVVGEDIFLDCGDATIVGEYEENNNNKNAGIFVKATGAIIDNDCTIDNYYRAIEIVDSTVILITNSLLLPNAGNTALYLNNVTLSLLLENQIRGTTYVAGNSSIIVFEENEFEPGGGINSNFFIIDSAHHNVVKDNYFKNTEDGINLQHGSYQNLVVDNEFEGNNRAIVIVGSDNNTIAENRINGLYNPKNWSRQAGIVIGDPGTKENEIYSNTISNMKECIYVKETSDSIIFNNNFIDCQDYAFDMNSSTWSSSEFGGNYWDVFYEENEGCVDNNSDNVCDGPYNIDNDSADIYPFTSKNGWELASNCIEEWACFGYGQCQRDNTSECTSVIEQSSCFKAIYDGDFSEFEPQQCIFEKKFIGVLEDINTSISNLTMLEDNNSLVFKQGDDTILEFDYNFSLGELNLNNLTIEKQPENSTFGYVIIKGLDLISQNETKTVYVDKLTDSFSVCIKDEEISSITEVTDQCNDEILVNCPGTNEKYSCELNSTLNQYKVSGLSHSGIKEQKLFCGDNVCNNDESCSSCSEDCGSCPADETSSPSNSGGGGSSSSGSSQPEEDTSSTVQQDGNLVDDNVIDDTILPTVEDKIQQPVEKTNPKQKDSWVWIIVILLFVLSIAEICIFVYYKKISNAKGRKKRKRRKR